MFAYKPYLTMSVECAVKVACDAIGVLPLPESITYKRTIKGVDNFLSDKDMDSEREQRLPLTKEDLLKMDAKINDMPRWSEWKKKLMRVKMWSMR